MPGKRGEALERWRTCVLPTLLLGALTLVLPACAGGHADASRALPILGALAPPLVIAHRGGTALWPENTLHAFRRARVLGADVLELDLQVTADGVLVVIHDPTVERTTDGRGVVRELTVEELQALDAGYRWSPDGGRTFPHRGRGLVVPTLDEVLRALPAAPLLVELKPAAASHAAELCRVLEDRDATGRVLVASMAHHAVTRFRRRCPAVATGATPREVARFVAARALRILPLPQLPAVAMQLPERWRGLPVLTPRVVAAAQARGLQVHAWTIDDEVHMRRLLALGVDGIVTDRPDRLLRVLGRPASLPPSS